MILPSHRKLIRLILDPGFDSFASISYQEDVFARQLEKSFLQLFSDIKSAHPHLHELSVENFSVEIPILNTDRTYLRVPGGCTTFLNASTHEHTPNLSFQVGPLRRSHFTDLTTFERHVSSLIKGYSTMSGDHQLLLLTGELVHLPNHLAPFSSIFSIHPLHPVNGKTFTMLSREHPFLAPHFLSFIPSLPDTLL